MADMVQEPSLQSLMASEGIAALSDDEALAQIASLIDAAADAYHVQGLERALEWCNALEQRPPSAVHLVQLEYFRANCWGGLKQAKRQDRDAAWAWEQPELQQELLHLRKAEHHAGFSQLNKLRQCQILTNIAGKLSTLGRFADAQTYWLRVLTLNPNFGMALGNRASGLFHYAKALYDPGHQAVFLRCAHELLSAATEKGARYESPHYGHVVQGFRDLREHIASGVDLEAAAEIDLDDFSMGRSTAERDYRRWCLQHSLFLNPLNDAVQRPIAATDILLLPEIVTSLDTSPIFHGFFNQLKQEFVAARWLYYEGINTTKVHFADRDVALYNTLDYPSYSIATEKVRATYRIAYSLFDKVAYFLNEYLELKMKPDKVYFKGLWYENGDRKRSVRAELNQSENWPLRGLFWLAKDLFHEKFSDLTEPDGRALHEIRNNLEHRHLKVHEFLPPQTASVGGGTVYWKDTLAYSVGRADFEAKTLRVLKLARAALIYLSLAIHKQEYRKRADMGDVLIAPAMLDLYTDDRKRRW